jgi:hypothetical protein
MRYKAYRRVANAKTCSEECTRARNMGMSREELIRKEMEEIPYE